MAKIKAKVKSPKKAALSSATKRNLFVVAVLLLCVGLVLFVLDQKSQKTAEYKQSATVETVVTKEPSGIGPSHGCKLIATNYVCDIKVNNPSERTLEWSSVITGIDGATLGNGGFGNVPADSSEIVELTVPKAFCETNPEGAGTVLILEDAKSTNQAETAFSCQPENTDSSTQPVEGN